MKNIYNTLKERQTYLAKMPKSKKKARQRKHHKTSIKKVIVNDLSKPNGVIENPFVVKSRVISNRVSSVIIGIQQPIIQMLGLNPNTWFRQYCDPQTKTIILEVMDK